MIRYLARRMLALIPVALGVATLTFALIHLVPGDPVVAMLGDTAAPADLAGMRHQLGLDRPLAAQYASFIIGLAHGNLGESISYHQPVARLIAERFPATLELAGAGLLVAILIAFPLGFIAGAKPGSAGDVGAMGFAILGISVPHIYLGPLLMILFSLDLRWFPLTGRGGLGHLVLPAVTLGTALAAIIARMLRQSLIAVSASDYMRTAISKGLSPTAALLRHGLRNAMTSVITLLGLELRRAFDRRTNRRGDLFLAGTGPDADHRDQRARLSTGRRMRPDVRAHLRRGEHGDRPRLWAGRSASES